MSGSNTANNLPPWLRDAPLPPNPDERATAPSAANDDVPDWMRQPGDARTLSTGAAAAADDVPDWLRQPNEPTSAGAANNVPDWLRQETPPTAARLSGGDEVPDWLRDLDTGLGDGRPAKASAPATDIPNWLRDEPTSPAPAADSIPDWLRDEPPATPPAGKAALPTEDGGRRTDAPLEDQQPTRALSAAEGTNDQSSAAASDMPSWLQDAPPSAPTTDHRPPTTGAVPDTSAVPSWLQDAPTEDGGRRTEAAAPASDVPSWLQDTTPSVTPTADGRRTTDPGALSDDDVPSWLQDIAAQPPAAPPAPPASAAPSTGLPAWLSDEPTTQAAPSASPPPADSVPTWMRDDPAPAAPTPAAPSPVDDVPAWLRDDPAPATPPAAASTSEDVPAWLRDDPAPTAPTSASPPADSVPAWLRDDPAPTAPTPPAASTGEDVPAWLRTEPTAAPALQSPITNHQTDNPPADDLPPWLRDASESPLPSADVGVAPWLRDAGNPPADVPKMRPTEPESGFLGATELPAWLRTPEPERTPEPAPSSGGRSLDWLSSISATDAPDTDVAEQPRTLPPRPSVTRTPAQLDSIALLSRIAADPFPAAPAVPAPARQTILRRVGLERVLYALLLIAVLVGALVPAVSAPLASVPVVPEAAQLAARTANLGPNDTVLLAYEWDARRVAELRPLERAVLTPLFARRTKFVSMSTDPQGALLSYGLRDQLNAAGYEPRGVDYILLGYKPGGEFALRQLAQSLPTTLSSDFDGTDANISVLATGTNTQRPLRSLSDFAMIIVMADDPSDVQGWMEQVHRTAPNVPITFLLPAEVNPIIGPYTRQENVSALAGRSGALAYEAIGADAGATANAAREAGRQRAALLAFVTLAVLGLIGLAIDGRRKRAR